MRYSYALIIETTLCYSPTLLYTTPHHTTLHYTSLYLLLIIQFILFTLFNQDDDARAPMLSKAPSMRKSSTSSIIPGGVKKAPATASGGTYVHAIYLSISCDIVTDKIDCVLS